MSRFFWKTLPTSTSRSARINSGDIALHIRVKDAIPKSSVKMGLFKPLNCAENRRSDFVVKCALKAVGLRSELVLPFDA